MFDPWLPLLKDLPLSRTEREVVKRFESDPYGRSFLPLADILRSHRLVDESLELLTEGVARHPGFTVARVVLTRELLHKGMVGEAWRVLVESPVPLKDNFLAQKLRFKLALLLSFEDIVKATYQHLTLCQMLDVETKRFGDMLEISGLEKAREHLIKELKDRGVDVVLPASPPPVSAAAAGSAALGSSSSEGALSSSSGQPLDENDESISNFHVVPLDEIFRPSEDAAEPRSADHGGIELDSTTLADIYAKQGLHAKALSVYRRMLRLTPNNDLLKRRVAELARLEREQKDADLTVDPTLVDRMETVEIIDRQIRFYNDLLSKFS